MPTHQPHEIVIHHIEGGRSFRPIWLCEELGLSYRLSFTQGNKEASMTSLRKAYPMMPMTPVVAVDGEIMVESGAILEVLEARFGPGRLSPPVASAAYPAFKRWIHFAEGTLMARAVMHRFISVATGVPVKQLPPGYRDGIDPPEALTMVGCEQCFRYMDAFLAATPYFSGDAFGLADIMLYHSIRMTRVLVGIRPEDYAHIQAWRARIEPRAAFVRAAAAACPSGIDEHFLPVGLPPPFPLD